MKPWRKHVQEKFHPAPKKDPVELARDLNLILRTAYPDPAERRKAAKRLAEGLPAECRPILLGQSNPPPSQS